MGGGFHWDRPAGNYVFFEGQELSLHSRLGSVTLFRLVTVARQNVKHV